ncbi:hypothetical protein ACFU6R_11715 [Streptomyces sp. NPDC057499]|uniref:hypothetical protein n=1 Tax=Streptomyces sp. NPDC057499 TaxID=3346150 RepID=UPI0036B7F147
MNRKIRITAASVVAAVTLGLAAPAANAASHRTSEPVATVRTIQFVWHTAPRHHTVRPADSHTKQQP